MRGAAAAAVVIMTANLVASCQSALENRVSEISSSSQKPSPAESTGDIHTIKHVIIIMQENRSFDSYFGTFPGADGIPPDVCVPDPAGPCVRPYHETSDVNGGGPHSDAASKAD